MERVFKGVWIPAEIWLNENLTVMEKVLYAEIDSFCGNGKECFCSNAHFAKLLQVSERQVQRLLVSLEKKGIISKRMVYREGCKEIEKRYLKPVHVTTPHDNIVTTPPDETVTPPGDENVVGTNPSVTNPLGTNIESVSNDTPPSKKTSRSKKFVPPTLDEVRTYIQENNLNVDADFFYKYYGTNDWYDSNGKPVKSWKHKCLTWDRQSDRQNGNRPAKADREKESAEIRAELERKMQSA